MACGKGSAVRDEWCAAETITRIKIRLLKTENRRREWHIGSTDVRARRRGGAGNCNNC
jgi:hypothetical protein